MNQRILGLLICLFMSISLQLLAASSKEDKALIKQMKKEYKMTKVEELRLVDGRRMYRLHNLKGLYCLCNAAGEQIVPNVNMPDELYRIDVKDVDGPLIIAHVKGTFDNYFCDENGHVLNLVSGIITWVENAHLWTWTSALGSSTYGLLRYDGSQLLPEIYSEIKFCPGTTKAILTQKHNMIHVSGAYDYKQDMMDVPVLNYAIRYDIPTGQWYTRRWEIDRETRYVAGSLDGQNNPFLYQGQYYFACGALEDAEQLFLAEPASNPYRDVYLHHIYRKRETLASKALEKELKACAKYTGNEGYERLIKLNELHCDEMLYQQLAVKYAETYVDGDFKTYSADMNAYLQTAQSANPKRNAEVKAKIYAIKESLMNRCISKEKESKSNILEYEKKIAYENGLSKALHDEMRKYTKAGDTENLKIVQRKIKESDNHVATYKKNIITEDRKVRSYDEYYDLLQKFNYEECK